MKKPKNGVRNTIAFVLAVVSLFFPKIIDWVSSTSNAINPAIVKTDGSATVLNSLEGLKTNYKTYYDVVGVSEINPVEFPVPYRNSDGLLVTDEVYHGLDDLGRTLGAKTTVTYDEIKQSEGWRESWESDHHPAGWFRHYKDGLRIQFAPVGADLGKYDSESNNAKVKIPLENGKVYSGWFYNASHLIADSLGGRAFRENAVTATRTQNVGNNDKKTGIQYIEMKVLNYINDNPSVVVYYHAEPVYYGSELLPRIVVVSALSSDGLLDEKVVTYNDAKGFSINYKTGVFFNDSE